MKFFAVTILAFAICCDAMELRNIQRPMDSPHYKEIVRNLMPGISFDENENQEKTITGRITRGTPATLGQFPHQVYMYLLDDLGAYICGGSIIHQRWVLTAAHCLYQKVKVEVYFGAINRYSEGAGSYVRAMVVTNVRSIIIHEGYDDTSLQNDIGLLELPQNAPFESQFVAPIQLPSMAERTRNLANVQGTVSGFGNID